MCGLDPSIRASHAGARDTNGPDRICSPQAAGICQTHPKRVSQQCVSAFYELGPP